MPGLSHRSIPALVGGPASELSDGSASLGAQEPLPFSRPDIGPKSGKSNGGPEDQSEREILAAGPMQSPARRFGLSDTDAELGRLDQEEDVSLLVNLSVWQRLKHLPRQIGFMVVNEAAERFAYYTLTTVLLLYFVSLGLDSRQARLSVLSFVGLVYTSPLVGAVLADEVFGRYPVILYVSLIYFAGLVIMTLAAFGVFGSQQASIILSYIGLAIVGGASGGIKPTVSSLAADQLVHSGKSWLLPFFFSLWYLMVNVGSTIGTVVSPLIRDAFGYRAVFLLTAVLLGGAVFVFWMGHWSYYRIKPSSTSTTREMFTVIVRAAYNYWFRWNGVQMEHPKVDTDGAGSLGIQASSDEPTQAGGSWVYTRRAQAGDSMTCFPATTISPTYEAGHILSPGEHVLRARLAGKAMPGLDAALCDCPAYHVNELRAMLTIIVVLAPLIVFYALYTQNSTTIVVQAESLDRRLFGRTLAPETLAFVDPVLLLVFIPVYEAYVLPGIRRTGYSFPPLHRMRVGMLLIVAAFVSAAVVQVLVDTGHRVHLLWQLPFWVLFSMAEVLAAITALELAYSQTPVRLKAVVTALFWLSIALGSYLTLFILLSNVLEHFQLWVTFSAYAVLMLVTVIVFIPLTWRYRYVDVVYGDGSISWRFDPVGAVLGHDPAEERTAEGQTAPSARRYTREMVRPKIVVQEPGISVDLELRSCDRARGDSVEAVGV